MSWPYLMMCLFVLSFYYFFTEKLPWFWYDDIYWIEFAQRNSVLALLGDIFNFSQSNFGFDRPTLGMFMKMCNFLFGEDPHHYRITKVFIYLLTLSYLFHFLRKNGCSKDITTLSIMTLATFPSVMIVTAWVNEAATFALFFEVISFVVFFHLLSSEDHNMSAKSIVLGGLLIVLIIFADKAKVTAKIAPLILLTYLFLTKNKNIFLYAIVLLSIIAVFPYALINGGSSAYYFKTADANNLFKTFLSQTWALFFVVLIMGVSAWKTKFYKSNFILFSLIWLTYELLFFFVYPSGEMRYLFSSLTAAIVFLSAIASALVGSLSNESFRKTARYCICLGLIYLLFFNLHWSYSFRGSVSQIILADKKMRFINENFRNTLCLYEDFTLLYYTRNQSNNLYVNIAPRYGSNPQFSGIYTLEPQGGRILNPEKYDNIIVLDRRLMTNENPPPEVIFDTKIPGSLYDNFQKNVNCKIYVTNPYNTRLVGPYDYPAHSSIYKVK